MLVFISVIVLWIVARRYSLPAAVKTGLHLMLATVLLQVGLGISTLLLHVPVSLAATHQAGALLLLTIALYTYHRMAHAA